MNSNMQKRNQVSFCSSMLVFVVKCHLNIVYLLKSYSIEDSGLSYVVWRVMGWLGPVTLGLNHAILFNSKEKQL